MYLFSLGPAQANKSELGAPQLDPSSTIRFLLPTTIKGRNGEQLFLGHRFETSRLFGFGLYLQDSSYVLGIKGKPHGFYHIDHMLHQRLSARHLLPRQLPPYAITRGDVLKGYSFWIVFAALFFALKLLQFAFHKRPKRTNFINSNIPTPRYIELAVQRTLAKAILADGGSNQMGLDMAKAIYERIMGEDLDANELNNALEWIIRQNGQFIPYLSQLGSTLTHDDKLTLIQAVALIVASDGEFSVREELEIRTFADHLDLSPQVVKDIVTQILRVINKSKKAAVEPEDDDLMKTASAAA